MMQRLLLLLVCTGFALGLEAQFIDAYEIDSWQAQEKPGNDFDLNSAYVYLINSAMLPALYDGSKLSKEERKKVGLKKGDYPQYMYTFLDIQNPQNKEENLHFPLLMYDVRDNKNINNAENYGGKYIDKIPSNLIKSKDIMAKAEVRALKGNSSMEFWARAAQISVDLGKTAINLVGSSGLSAFSDQMLPFINKGLTSLESMANSEEINSSFFITLFPAEYNEVYEEKLVSARLYAIYYEGQKVRKANLIEGNFQTVGELKNSIKSKRYAYILIVNTKSEYNTSHHEIAYDEHYYKRKESDWTRIRNPQKRQMERLFLNDLKKCIRLKDQLHQFNQSLETSKPDWQSYCKSLDLYYQLRKDIEDHAEQRWSADPFFANQYAPLYKDMEQKSVEWMMTPMLKKARNIAHNLIGKEAFNTRKYSNSDYYEKIKKLDFYRSMTNRIKQQAKSTQEIEGLLSYRKTLEFLKELEEELYANAFRIDPLISAQKEKELLIKWSTEDFSSCLYCRQMVSERIGEIDRRTLEEKKKKYEQLSEHYYNTLDCYQEVEESIREQIQNETNLLPAYIRESLLIDLEKFVEYRQIYTQIAGRDVSQMNPQELTKLISDYELNQEKINLLIARLKKSTYLEQNCL